MDGHVSAQALTWTSREADVDDLLKAVAPALCGWLQNEGDNHV